MKNREIEFRFWNEKERKFHFPQNMMDLGALFVLVGSKQGFIPQQYTGLKDCKGTKFTRVILWGMKMETQK